MNTKQLCLTASLIILSAPVMAAKDNWFVKPYIGLSQMSDLSTDFANIDSLNGVANVDLDNGFAAGIGLGYRYTQNLGVEVGWEYRSNDSKVNLSNLSVFDDGNYASNLFYLNGQYSLNKKGKFQPYFGGGLTWAQEIDIDIERNGAEQSFSSDGDMGYQLFAGVNYDLGKKLSFQSELRYGKIADIDLEAEQANSGKFNNMDYETTSLQMGLVYDF